VKLKSILEKNGSEIEDIYNYVRGNFRYKRMDKSSDEEMIIYFLNYRRGACYHFATMTDYLLRAGGYESMVINGDGLDTTGDGVPDASEHYWTLVKIDGEWYHLDALQGQYLKTDKELVELGYNWEFEDFPSTP